MTYEETIKQLDSLMEHCSLLSKESKCYIWQNDIEALEIAKVVLEKQIPKKPEEWDGEYLSCPTCGGILAKSFEDKYCYECGRKLDWSDFDWSDEEDD